MSSFIETVEIEELVLHPRSRARSILRYRDVIHPTLKGHYYRIPCSLLKNKKIEEII